MARESKVWWWKARGRWAANFHGKRHVAPRTIGKDDRIAAEKWYVRAKARAGTVPVGDVTLAVLCEQYLDWDDRRVKMDRRDPAAHRSTRSKMTTACKAWVGQRQAGEIPIEEFTPGHIQAMVNAWIGDGHGPSYVRELTASVGSMFAWACKQIELRPPLLEANPVRGVELPPAPAVEPRFADRAEAAAWLRWLRRSGKLGDYVMLQRCLIHTGARPSEWTRATWGDINWTLNQVIRERWKSRHKTDKPRRIFIPRRLRRSLARGFARAGRNKGARIFSTPRGVAWQASNLSTTTQRYRDEAIADGLAFAAEGPDRLTCYRWRHTAASTLLMEGIDMATVAELLGTSVNMVQKTYGHLQTGHLSHAAEKLSNRRRLPPVS